MAGFGFVAAALLCCVASTLGFSTQFNITNGSLYSFSCNGTAPAVMLYFKDIRYHVANSSSNISLANGGVPGELTGCDQDKTVSGTKLVATVLFKGSGSEKEDLKFDFHFRRTNGRLSPKTASSTNTSFYWELTTIVVDKSANAKEATCFLPSDENDWVIAPLNFSFSCQPHRAWVPWNAERSWRTRQDHSALNVTCASSNVSNIVLNITGLQVQAFSFSSKGAVRFGDAADCVGFFTGPTIMGFIIGFFLLSIVLLVSIIFLGTETPSFRPAQPGTRPLQVS